MRKGNKFFLKSPRPSLPLKRAPPPPQAPPPQKKGMLTAPPRRSYIKVDATIRGRVWSFLTAGA